jgi:hypothetical protein
LKNLKREYRRDWDGVRELISADARLNVADGLFGLVADAPYLANWERWSMPWKLALAEVDCEPTVMILQRGPDTWTPYSVVRFELVNNLIDHIRDYAHCPWVIVPASQIDIQSVSI